MLPRPFQNLIERFGASNFLFRRASRVVPRVDRVLHRLSGGRFMLGSPAIPTILLTTKGARSGRPISSPLAMVTIDGARYVVGSNFGGQRHPGWSYNLLADPQATMSFSGDEIRVRAELLDDDEKGVLWPELVRAWPPYESYVERSGRDLRVFRLTPCDADGGACGPSTR